MDENAAADTGETRDESGREATAGTVGAATPAGAGFAAANGSTTAKPKKKPGIGVVLGGIVVIVLGLMLVVPAFTVITKEPVSALFFILLGALCCYVGVRILTGK